jgi:hypothetical protein
VTAFEEKLQAYKEPSSSTEQEKQERAERMVREAIENWKAFQGFSLRILPKGSYVNNTNVRADSDVDIAVIQLGSYLLDTSALPERLKSKVAPKGDFVCSAADFRAELERALRAKFGKQCDTSGRTALTICETSSRVSVDVVPSFPYRRYSYDWWFGAQYCEGTTTRRKNGIWVVNYPEQQLANGRRKNRSTNGRYKHLVRILKRIENELSDGGVIKELPSYFIECLVYNVPDGYLNRWWSFSPLTAGLNATLRYLEEATTPGGDAEAWKEPNGIKQLFDDAQSWSLGDARDLVSAAQDFVARG